MYITHRMEEFSKAFVLAIAACCGVRWAFYSQDQGSVDVSFKKTTDDDPPIDVQIDAQLKSTMITPPPSESFSFDLPVNNYNHLVSERRSQPIVLIIVVVPTNTKEWLTHSNNDLILRHCGYLVNLQGKERSNNKESVRIYVSPENRFTPESFNSMFNAMAQEVIS